MTTTCSGSAPPDPAKRFGSREVDNPRSGFFLCRLVKGGPFVPCEIRVEFEQFSVSIDGRPFSSPTPTPHRDRVLMDVWTYGSEIDDVEYQRLLRREGERPDPFTPIDLNSRPSLF